MNLDDRIAAHPVAAATRAYVATLGGPVCDGAETCAGCDAEAALTAALDADDQDRADAETLAAEVSELERVNAGLGGTVARLRDAVARAVADLAHDGVDRRLIAGDHKAAKSAER